jgi:hypothetical protein
MSEIAKELTLPELVELADAELDAVAAGVVRPIPDNASHSPVVYGFFEFPPAPVPGFPPPPGTALLVTP